MKRTTVRALAKAVLAYHAALVEVAKDRVRGSMVTSKKLDDLYQVMLDKARLLLGKSEE